MADFKKALVVILQHEGGYVDDAKDPGGATNYGISLRFLKDHGLDLNSDGDVDADDIRGLTPDQAGELYRKFFWDANRCGEFCNDTVGTKVMDMCVNMGGVRAIKLAQQAANDCGHACTVDGKIGPATIEAINTLDATQYLDALCGRQADYYNLLVQARPPMVKFLKGWLRRAAWPNG